MRYSTLRYILDNKDLFWSNGTTGAGDNSVDKVISNDPNDFLQPLAGNKFYKAIALIAVIGITVALIVMAAKNKKQ